MRLVELQEARESGWSWDRSGKEGAGVFWGLLSGYGTNFRRVAVWVLGVNLVFTLLYYIWGELLKYDSPEGKQDFTFKPRLLDMPWDYIRKGAFPEVKPKAAGGEDNMLPTVS